MLWEFKLHRKFNELIKIFECGIHRAPLQSMSRISVKFYGTRGRFIIVFPGLLLTPAEIVIESVYAEAKEHARKLSFDEQQHTNLNVYASEKFRCFSHIVRENN